MSTALINYAAAGRRCVTSIPLVLFAVGARLVPYSTIGILQFIAPTMQLVCGLLVFRESIGADRALGFVLIWIGLLVYVANALWPARGRVTTDLMPGGVPASGDLPVRKGFELPPKMGNMAPKPLPLVHTRRSPCSWGWRARERGDQPDPDPPDRAARLAYLKGDVSMQPSGEDEWAPRCSTARDHRRQGLDRGGRVEIQVGRSARSPGWRNSFSFLDLGDDTVQMRMTAGTLILDVQRAAGPRADRDRHAQHRAGDPLRPGSYRVEVNDAGDATTVKIGKGEAEANGPSTNTLVHDGQAVTFRGIDELVADTRTLGPADEFDRWSMDRERRDDRVATSRTAEYVSPDVTGYDDLDEYGSWSSEPEYGYVWTPTRVVLGWSPYRFGRWVWVSPWGWSWVDDSPWGYAPFHYGRWAHVRNRWCWVPGPRHVRAVYAPALVGWVGSRGNYVSWVPLGPRDVYRPGHRFSRHYWERVNFANARNVDRTRVRDVFDRRGGPDDFNNRSIPDGVTAVPRASFAGAQRVGERRVRFNEREMAGHDGNGDNRPGPRVTPVRESRLGGVTRANPRIPPAIAARQVIVEARAAGRVTALYPTRAGSQRDLADTVRSAARARRSLVRAMAIRMAARAGATSTAMCRRIRGEIVRRAARVSRRFSRIARNSRDNYGQRERPIDRHRDRQAPDTQPPVERSPAEQRSQPDRSRDDRPDQQQRERFQQQRGGRRAPESRAVQRKSRFAVFAVQPASAAHAGCRARSDSSSARAREPAGAARTRNRAFTSRAARAAAHGTAA